ncbi:mCG145533, partial [Mus musculus]
ILLPTNLCPFSLTTAWPVFLSSASGLISCFVSLGRCIINDFYERQGSWFTELSVSGYMASRPLARPSTMAEEPEREGHSPCGHDNEERGQDWGPSTAFKSMPK